METCFVMQPFDGGPYDKRYQDVFEPAIRSAEMDPYRVDNDPAVVIPIEEIEAGIRKADYCLAEISTDNPNVWFELGFAIASGKLVVLVCSEDRKAPFPFDVRHRLILKYKTESTQDFEKLRHAITRKLVAARKQQVDLTRIEDLSPIAKTEGLSEHEMVALVVVAQSSLSPNDTVSSYTIKHDMNKAGFTDLAATLAMRGLLAKGYVEAGTGQDRDGPYTYYELTHVGLLWLTKQQHKLELRKPAPRALPGSEDDIPF